MARRQRVTETAEAVIRRLMLALAATAALAGCTSTPISRTPDLRIAITIDDLPVHGDYPADETPAEVTRAIVGSLRREGVSTAHGFINGHWIDQSANNVKALEEWSAGSFPAANHGWSHRRLSEITLEEFEREVAANEPLIKTMAEREEDWRWFRYPFLDEGEDVEKRLGSRQILARRGYRIAAVTMDSNDWQWTAPYARCKSAGDEPTIAWLEQSYMHSLGETVSYYRSLSNSIYGRDIPYVLLLHVSAFEGRMLPRLLALLREQGFRFVSLAEAQADPAYAADNDPRLPPEPHVLEGKAAVKGIQLPPRRDYAPILETICRAPAADSR